MTPPITEPHFAPERAPLRAAIELGLARIGDGLAFERLGANLECEFSLTGRALRELSVALAHRLCGSAEKPARIAIVTPSGPEFLVAILAGIYSGIEGVAPPFPSPGPTKKRFEKIMMQSRPDCVLAATDDLDNLREELQGMGLANVPILPIALEALQQDTDALVGQLPDADCRILQYTSGTSGSPRAVCLTGANIAANTELTVQSWNLSTADSMLTWLPHHHDMGLFGCIITSMVVGGPVHQMSPFNFLKRPSRWMEAVSRTRATLTGGPAFAMRLAVEARGSIDALDLSCVRGVFCGSEPIAPDLLKRFAARFEPAGLNPEATFSCYGLAESTLYVACRPGAGLTPACEIFDDGVHEVRIVDPETRTPLGAGEEGEVWVSGPSIASAYLEAPEESEATFEGKLRGDRDPARKWLRTGDLGRISGGKLTVSGRIKDMIIANGANVPAAEIEWSATSSNPVFDGMAATCFALGPLEEGQTALVLEVEKRAVRDLDADQVRKTIRAAVRATHGVDLSKIMFVRRGTLPRTTSGKVQRNLVREMLLQGELVEAGANSAAPRPVSDETKT